MRRSIEGKGVGFAAAAFDLTTIASVFAEFRNEVQHPAFWLAVGKIIWIDVLLSGDNALVIALACRGLAPPTASLGHGPRRGCCGHPPHHLRGIVTTLMELPYLKLAGGLALLVIAAKLLVPEKEDEEGVAADQPSLGCRSGGGCRRHRHEPRQCDCGRCGCEWQRAAVDYRAGYQRAADRDGRRADHDAADTFAFSGVGRIGVAGLGRRRSHRDRSGGCATAASILRHGRRYISGCGLGDGSASHRNLPPADPEARYCVACWER